MIKELHCLFCSPQPVVLDDYSDPKDVLKSSVDGGPLPMGPEGPLSNQPYAEDDYSVPYGVIKRKLKVSMGVFREKLSNSSVVLGWKVGKFISRFQFCARCGIYIYPKDSD